MNIISEQDSIDDLSFRKKAFRERMKNLTPTEKIQQLELLQRRYYTLLAEREKSGGRAVPRNWRRWKEAQDGLA